MIKKFKIVGFSVLTALILTGGTQNIAAMAQPAMASATENCQLCELSGEQKVGHWELPCLHRFCKLCLVNIHAHRMAIGYPSRCPIENCNRLMFEYRPDSQNENQLRPIKLETDKRYKKILEAAIASKEQAQEDQFEEDGDIVTRETEDDDGLARQLAQFAEMESYEQEHGTQHAIPENPYNKRESESDEEYLARLRELERQELEHGSRARTTESAAGTKAPHNSDAD